MPHACNCAFGSIQGLFCMRICPRVMIMLNHLVQVQVGSAGSQRDIIFITLT